MAALDIPAGPAVGSLLDRLLELVMVDPMLNDRSLLLTRARELAAAELPPRPSGAPTRGPREGDPA